MEENTLVTPVEIEQELQALAPLAIIRTETELSKYPIHNLSKKGSVNIHIAHSDSKGKVDLLWKVSPSRDYGEPRALAYKFDTIVINRRIDEQGRPLPKIIRLGSLRELAQELELGSDTAAVRKALLQNASAFITAKLTYKTNDGRSRRLETGFTRYSVVFTGEQLPDGTKADAVFLILNDPYREVLNNAPVRPLDYDYLRKLPPAAQRFYEILSRKLFAALKWKHGEAALPYSEYCTYSAQRRYFDRQPMQNQMSAIHREHKKFGYIASVRYQPIVDAENRPDWLLHYVPGPKAKAEYHAFTRSGRTIDLSSEGGAGEGAISAEPRLMGRRSGPRQKHLRFAAGEEAPQSAPQSIANLAELTKRGIGEGKARALLAGTDPELILDQLEWGDHLIANTRSAIVNPPGFYIHLVSTGVTPPETFETSRRRKAREAAREAHNQELVLRYEREQAYDNFRKAAIDQHIEQHLRPKDYAALVDTHMMREQGAFYKNLPDETKRQVAERAARFAIARDLNLPTLEEFCGKLERGEAIGAS